MSFTLNTMQQRGDVPTDIDLIDIATQLPGCVITEDGDTCGQDVSECPAGYWYQEDVNCQRVLQRGDGSKCKSKKRPFCVLPDSKLCQVEYLDEKEELKAFHGVASFKDDDVNKRSGGDSKDISCTFDLSSLSDFDKVSVVNSLLLTSRFDDVDSLAEPLKEVCFANTTTGCPADIFGNSNSCPKLVRDDELGNLCRFDLEFFENKEVDELKEDYCADNPTSLSCGCIAPEGLTDYVGSYNNGLTVAGLNERNTVSWWTPCSEFSNTRYLTVSDQVKQDVLAPKTRQELSAVFGDPFFTTDSRRLLIYQDEDVVVSGEIAKGRIRDGPSNISKIIGWILLGLGLLLLVVLIILLIRNFRTQITVIANKTSGTLEKKLRIDTSGVLPAVLVRGNPKYYLKKLEKADASNLSDADIEMLKLAQAYLDSQVGSGTEIRGGKLKKLYDRIEELTPSPSEMREEESSDEDADGGTGDGGTGDGEES